MALQGFLDDDRKALTINGFRQVVVCAASHGLDCGLDGAERGHDQDLDLRPPLFKVAKKFHAAYAGHFKIGEDQINRGRLQLLHCLLRACGSAHLILFLLKQRHQGFPDVQLIVDDENAASRCHEVAPSSCGWATRAGKRRPTEVPLPGALETVMRPPWSCMIRYAIARP